MNFFQGAAVWVVVAIGVLLVAWCIWRTVVAARQVARRPAASVQALRMHDAAVGWAARALAIVVFVAISIVGSGWSPTWIRGGGWLGVVGAFTVLGLIVMELRWPTPGGTVRSASLTRRRVRDIAPRNGRAVAGMGVGVGALSIIICGSIARDTGAANPGFGWPGWAETWPLAVGLVVTIAATAVAAIVLVRRPALAGLGAAIDLGYRRAAMDRVMRVSGVVGFLSAANVAQQLHNVTSGPLATALPVSTVFAWQAVGLFVAAFLSVEFLRAKVPQEFAAVGCVGSAQQ